MNYGLMKYFDYSKNYNVGDNIQSLAAKQFLPKVDSFLDRERLAEYKGEKIKLIMNGWFTHNLNDWLPSDDIIPLFVSFHVNDSAAKFILNEKGVSYLKKHEPIGCRDQFTVDLLKDKGVAAYFTGCLTLTLDSYSTENSMRDDEIYIVDVLHSYPTSKKMMHSLSSFGRYIISGKIFQLGKRRKHINKIISNDLLSVANYIDQEPPVGNLTNEDKFEFAEDLLKKYSKAKLVITSRIHCALPCLAMGTPVIFVNGFDNLVDSCRFEGIVNLFNRIDIDSNTGNWDANFLVEGKITEKTKVVNLKEHTKLVENLKSKCEKFISN